MPEVIKDLTAAKKSGNSHSMCMVNIMIRVVVKLLCFSSPATLTCDVALVTLTRCASADAMLTCCVISTRRRCADLTMNSSLILSMKVVPRGIIKRNVQVSETPYTMSYRCSFHPEKIFSKIVD